MHAYGFSIESLNLFSYLRGRKQRVKISSVFSKWLEILLGIPQGSILGPLLFNIFINDLFYFILETDICNFADDNTIYACNSSFSNVCNKLERELHRVNKWFHNNSMVANPAKFQLMFLGKNIPENFSISLNGQIIPQKIEVELLGMIIDCKLNFSSHIKKVCKSANNKISAFMRIRKALNISQAKHICNAYILPFFYYCPIIWMFCTKSNMKLINKTHKRVLRTVYDDSSLSLQDLLAIDNSCNIHQRHLQLLMTEIYKTIHKQNPKLLWDMFCEKPNVHHLRSKSLFLFFYFFLYI